MPARLRTRVVPLAARLRTRVVPLALGILAFALAFVQRPGWSSSDTKIDLHTAPVRFLGEIASLWTPSSGLGGVESAQYAGYLFPMGPFFALGHLLGIGDWVVERLWLGLLLAIGCWGMVRLAQELDVARTRTGAAVAGLVYLLNPYVVVFANRTTITLLAYALLPWLVLVAHRALRAPTRWRLAAVFALLVTASGGGVNAAVVALALLGPLAIVLYEPLTGAVPWRAAWQFGWRAAAATFVASLWWLAPAAAQSAYGVDFLRFTEPAGAIWATTSLSESFRAMGYWISYIGVGFNGVVRPYFSDASTMVFNHLVVVASMLVPGLAVLAFTWTRRRRYAAFFLLLVLAGTLVMAVGFPEGTPLRRGATFAYNHFASVRFLRTTYKAAPLVVLGIAGLAALGIERVRVRWRAAAAVGAVAVLAAAAWPLVSGDAVDPQVSWKHVPADWSAAASDLDRSLGKDARAVVLPGQLYAFYRWGGTVDPILPALTSKPVAVRNAVPYGDLRGTDLLWTADALLQQGRLLPGELPPLLQLMSARQVVSATDDDLHRSGAIDPVQSQAALAAQGLAPRRVYGPSVRSFSVPGVRPLVRVERRAPLNVVDGGAEGVAALAADGALPARDAFAYAGDLGSAQIRAAARAGGSVLITDSNRRRVFVVSRLAQNSGATLAAGDPISADAAMLDPFPTRGTDAQTVAVIHGARSIRAPFSPGYAQFPENRPLAAFDGDPRTAWLADRALDPARQRVDITFDRPRPVDAIDVLPRNEAGARTVALIADGRRFALGTGWTHLVLGLKDVATLSLRVVSAHTGSAAAGGLAEVRIRGLRVSESLRPPVEAERALAGTDLSHTRLAYAFTRASGDQPRRRRSSAGARIDRFVGNPSVLEQLRVDQPGDEEVAIDRQIDPPAARTYDVSAWLSVTPEARDSAIDRLVGARGRLTADSSARFDGIPAVRASSAVDGNPATAWEAPWDAADPWLEIRTASPIEFQSLRLDPAAASAAPDAAGRIARPTRIQLAWPGGRTPPLNVVAGRVVLPQRIRTSTFKLTVLAAAPATARAVGIAELSVPGLKPLAVPRAGPLRAGCGAVAVDGAGTRAGLRVLGDVADLDAARPLRAVGCAKLALRPGPQRVRSPAATLRADSVLLSSPAPVPIARTAATAGSVTDAGNPGRGSRENVKLRVNAPAWLVLGESYDRGWRAACNGRSLGQPVPLDGYANAWPVSPGCREASFTFAPQRPVHIIQILSALACLLLLGTALRRGQTPYGGVSRARAGAGDWPDLAPRRLPLRRAVAGGVAVAAVLGFCFSVRSGLLIAPATAFVLWRGVPAAPLAALGGLLLAVAVPLAYLLFPPVDFGGYNAGYAGDQIATHWIAVAAWVLLVLALWRVLSTATRRRDGQAAARADAGA